MEKMIGGLRILSGCSPFAKLSPYLRNWPRISFISSISRSSNCRRWIPDFTLSLSRSFQREIGSHPAAGVESGWSSDDQRPKSFILIGDGAPGVACGGKPKWLGVLLSPDPVRVQRMKMALLTWLAGGLTGLLVDLVPSQLFPFFLFYFLFVNLFIFLISFYKTNGQYFVKQYYTRFLYFRYF